MSRNQDIQNQPLSNSELRTSFARLRGDRTAAPSASVVLPVNAQGDLDNVRSILSDLAQYQGDNTIEVVLMINNYDEAAPPSQIAEFAELGARVVAEANARRSGECIGFTARVAGARAASADLAILFDADCRIPNATAVIDWYVDAFRAGSHVAYTHVAYFEMRDSLPNRVRLAVHHAARWTKRVILRIPTLRGSNYAIDRSMLLRLYADGWLADDMNVGPTCRAMRMKIAYSGAKDLVVLTSGRMFSGTSWIRLNRYFLRRLRFNLRVLRVRPNAASYTQREFDPERRYVDNHPVY